MNSPASRAATQPTAASRGLLLGTAVGAGWVLHDLGVFADSRQPPLALEILPGSALVVLGGALVGWSSARWRAVLPVALFFFALAAVFGRRVLPSAAHTEVWLPRALFLSLAGLALASALAARLRLGAARAGILAGVLGAFAMASYRDCVVSRPVLLAALACGALGWLARPGVRRLGTLLACLCAAAWLGWRIAPQLSPSRADLAPAPRTAASAAPNLLLIVLDTLRADHLAPYGYERVTTPGLDAYVRSGFTRYANARSASSWTLPSHMSLFTGLRPAEHGSVHSGIYARPLRADVPTLAEILREAGYQTAAVVSNDVYLRPFFGIDRGFERFDDRDGGVVGTYIAFAQLCGLHLRAGHLAYRDGETITDAALAWLEEERREGPFFLMLNYMDVHAPNIPEPPFDRAFGEEQPRDPLQPDPAHAALLYDRELLYLDRHLTRLLAAFEEHGLFERTTIVITSDHGEGIGEHGVQRHGRVLYESLVRVPLYVKPPGARAHEVVLETVTGSDVFHLALELCGLRPATAPKGGPLSEWYTNPRDPSLTTPPKRPDLVCWTSGRIKTIVSRLGLVEAYDLERDPGELAPLSLTAEETAAALARAQAWWDDHPVEAASRSNDEDTERLRALGYMDDED